LTTFVEHEYTIARHWVCALEYGNYSGLEAEIKDLEAFLATLPATGGCWDWGTDDDTNFALDEISGLYADCVRAKYLVPQD
jgi:hypothetical protein